MKKEKKKKEKHKKHNTKDRGRHWSDLYPISFEGGGG